MFTKLDLALLVCCLASGALALESHGRLDISPDNRTITLDPVVCRLAPPDVPFPNSIDIAVQLPPDQNLVDFAIDCRPA